VATSQGRLLGLRRDGHHAFLGIPFARSPRGNLRFEPPQQPEPWAGVLDVTRHPPAAPQNPGDGLGLFFLDRADGISEDCLRLNLWTPGLDDRKRPVLVWIHGGRFLHGSASEQISDGGHLAVRGDVVVVALQYRLGPLGFLHLGHEGGCSNLGLRDQIAALDWVRREIGAFGGDPDNVTLFGQSAGAISAGVLMAAPQARGLFHRVILQSGPPVAVDPEAASPVTETFFRAGGLVAESLHEEPIEKLLATEGACLASPGIRPLDLPYMPVVDGDVVPGDPTETIAAGRGTDVPLLIGTTRDEMTAYLLLDPATQALDHAGLQQRCERMLGDAGLAGEAIRLYGERRRARDEPAEPRDLWFAILADRHVRSPSLRLAEAVARRGQAVYCYRFDWVSPFMEGALGACHSIDIPFVFGSLGDPHLSLFTGNGAEATALGDFVADAWLAFARGGEPASGWPRYEETRRATMLLGASRSVENDPGAEERRFWDRMAI
jgi:para-nitrobenzyl esterase